MVPDFASVFFRLEELSEAAHVDVDDVQGSVAQKLVMKAYALQMELPYHGGLPLLPSVCVCVCVGWRHRAWMSHHSVLTGIRLLWAESQASFVGERRYLGGYVSCCPAPGW